jgi:rod shape-determining protein MreC
VRGSNSLVAPTLLCLLGILLGVLQNQAKGRVDARGEAESRPARNGGVDFVTRTVQFVVLPPTRALDRALGFVGDTAMSFAEAGRLRARVRELETTLAERVDRTRRLEALERENTRLRALQRLPNIPNYRQVKADIIAVSLSSQRVSLNVGRKHGVLPGAPVIVPNGLVGQVVEVAASVSHVNLVTHPRFAVGARVFRADSQEIGILRGRGSDRMVLTIYKEPTVSLSALIRGGDEVTTSGLSDVYPAGILIGRVAEANQNRMTGVIEATVVPAVNIAKVREVVVLVR